MSVGQIPSTMRLDLSHILVVQTLGRLAKTFHVAGIQLCTKANKVRLRDLDSSGGKNR
jgi:hypothetical protein